MDDKTTTHVSSCEPEKVIPEVLPSDDKPGPTKKIKGAAQMAAGGAIAAVGVPMLVLPGPGAAAIAGGAALACKGHRTYTGRKPTFAEEKLDMVAEKAADVAKEATKKVARDAVAAAPVVAKKAASQAPEVMGKALAGAGKVAIKGAKEAVHIGGKLADKGLKAVREKRQK